MTRLVEVVQALGVEADFAPSRHLVKIKGEGRTVYVAEVLGAWGAQYCTWCNDPQARAVELYNTARSDTGGAAARQLVGEGARELAIVCLANSNLSPPNLSSQEG